MPFPCRVFKYQTPPPPPPLFLTSVHLHSPSKVSVHLVIRDHIVDVVVLCRRSHSHWAPVKGSFSKDGNNFEFHAEKQGAGAAGPVASGEKAKFTGSINPVTFTKH